MKSNNIIPLLFIIIILFIVIDYCTTKKSVEAFEDEQTNPNSNPNTNTNPNTDEMIEEEINENIKNLKTERNNLVKFINTKEQKYKNNAEYLKNIKTKLNEILENDIENNAQEEKVVEEKIITIKDKLIYLNNYININGSKKNFNSIRSLQNGTKLSIDRIEGKPHYSIKLNNEKSILDDNKTDNCLSVKKNETYEIEKCDPNNEQQYFNLQNIPNEMIYKKHLEKGILKNKNIPNNINYPFNLIKSVNNKNCLQNFNNQISVTPCETKKSHRWEPLEENIYCSRDEK